MRTLLATFLLPPLLLCGGCGDGEDTAAKPAAMELTRDAVGHYCNMIVADHEGPKAQIFLTGQTEPIWFSSVRDAIAFTMLPDEPKTIAAIYVNDMGRATWASPEPGTWIDAEAAYYVIESRMRGGMGAAEAVPLADRAKAEAFAAEHGGRIVSLAEIPQDYILAYDAPAIGANDGKTDHSTHGGMTMKPTEGQHDTTQ
jgi:copper chaperone NosL